MEVDLQIDPEEDMEVDGEEHGDEEMEVDVEEERDEEMEVDVEEEREEEMEVDGEENTEEEMEVDVEEERDEEMEVDGEDNEEEEMEVDIEEDKEEAMELDLEMDPQQDMEVVALLPGQAPANAPHAGLATSCAWQLRARPHIPYNKPPLLKPNFRDLSSTLIYTVLESSAAGGSNFYRNSAPTISPRLIQAALGKGEAPEHLQYINDIIVSGNTATEVFEKGEKIIHILLEAGFAIKKSKVKGPAQEIQLLKVKWQDGRHQIPTKVINKTTATSPRTSKKETQAFLGAIGFWRMRIPEYSQIVSPLYLVTRKKNYFHWGHEQQQAFAQIKQEIARVVAFDPVRIRPKAKNMLYSTAGNNGLS
ncbi:hypothetical protein DUI87_35520 [Hirundo rustica rustica]|uniref:Reverse transcriptase/retrotransposon-derived protein RNase H-like domain-containing protein n=1 Tax=Hirundo rustica rustica TaxID=333673 RepID=A0A3M0IF33_HIRRU|nr:hypothetical protein DUI87_35520 [Hirundo rustica rustica]